MSAGSILNFLYGLNKIILCGLLANIILINKFDKFSNEPAQIKYSVYHIP
jgi:hypothetical protein